MGSFLTELFFAKLVPFFQKLESLLEIQRAKEKFSDNLGHNILEIYDFLAHVLFVTIKTKLDI